MGCSPRSRAFCVSFFELPCHLLHWIYLVYRCIEAVYKELKGVRKVVSGYAGGTLENPTYRVRV